MNNVDVMFNAVAKSSKLSMYAFRLLSSATKITVNFLNIRTPKKFVIALKFELCGSTIE